MRQAVEQCRRHLGVSEHARPFGKRQVRRHDHRGALIQTADEVEQYLTIGAWEWQVAQLVKDHEISTRQLRRRPSRLTRSGLGFQLVDQIHRVEEAHSRLALTHAVRADGDGQVCLARTRAPDQHDVAALGQEVASVQHHEHCPAYACGRQGQRLLVRGSIRISPVSAVVRAKGR